MMDAIAPNKIPHALKVAPNWVLWKLVTRDDRPTKLPYQVNGEMAKSNDKNTWNTFKAVWHCFQKGGYDGIGIVFQEDGDLCGIDLDGCRNPETGEMAPWARHIIEKFSTYAEVSPSKTGVKLFCIGRNPLGGGKKKEIANAERIADKTPAIEVYDKLRYFAVTGWRVRGPVTPEPRQDKINWLTNLYWPTPKPEALPPSFTSRLQDSIIERARKYVATMPPAVSGQDGHGRTFRVACVLVLGFGLSEAEAFGLLKEYNAGCQPPWSDRELAHKIKSASKQPGDRNYLRDAALDQIEGIELPDYREPKVVATEPEPSIITLDSAARSYLDELRAGPKELIRFGIPEVENAIGGGLEIGEFVVVAALPSHGKSALALQCAHAWTYSGMPSFIVSEEMSPRLLGKRTLQYISGIPEYNWHAEIEAVESELQSYASPRAPCFIAESCGSVDVAIEQIEKAIKEHGIKCAIVDYAQTLKAKGNSKYEQVTATSIALKQCAKKNNIIVMALSQLNKEIEKRPKFDPKLSDIADSSQISKDADVILFLCYPWKLDSTRDKQEYWFFIGKNRNRETKEWAVKCKFYADRQMIVPAPPPPVTEMRNYEPAFDAENW